jgi:hypothetical protein
MWYKAAADLMVVIHLLFIGFVIGGVFLDGGGLGSSGRTSPR